MSFPRWFGVILLGALATTLHAQSLSPEIQTRLDAVRAQAVKWAAQPVLVAAVQAQNAAPAPEVLAMTQAEWAGLEERAPFVHALAANDVAKFLREARTAAITEAFVSDAKGRKVGFLAKTTNWSHLGKPKHDEPMAGKSWQGKIEIDQSAGLHQIQLAVPVLADGKPVGSLVIGVSVTALKDE